MGILTEVARIDFLVKNLLFIFPLQRYILTTPIKGDHLDKQSLALGNDFDMSRSLRARCEHGAMLYSCADSRCREIWTLYQEQIKEQWAEVRAQGQAQQARKNRGEKTSQYEIALEKRAHVEAEETQGDPAGSPEGPKYQSFSDVFPDQITLRAAVQFSALTPRESKILEAYVEADRETPPTKLWDQIGRKVGWSGRTVCRRFKKLVERFLKGNDSTIPTDPPGTIQIVKIRGERKPLFYLKKANRFGKWEWPYSELLTDPLAVRRLLSEGRPVSHSYQVRIRSSPMNRLFGDLIAAFGEGLQKPERPPEYLSSTDWDYNVRRAQRLLAGKKNRVGPWTASQVYRILGRGSKLCKACHTPMLRGFKLNAQRITRRRDFCDDACKMALGRRKKQVKLKEERIRNAI